MILFPHERALFFDPNFWRYLTSCFNAKPGHPVAIRGHNQFGEPVTDILYQPCPPGFLL